MNDQERALILSEIEIQRIEACYYCSNSSIFILLDTFSTKLYKTEEENYTCTSPKPWGPFVNLQIDFIQMPKCCNFDYVFVILKMFSGWEEVYPCKQADATAVEKSC